MLQIITFETNGMIWALKIYIVRIAILGIWGGLKGLIPIA